MALARPEPAFPPEAGGWTPQQWLEWEVRRPERWELVGSRPRLMAGGTTAHNGIAINVAAALLGRLRGGPCRVHASDLKVLMPTGHWAYPDVFVRCSPRRGDETIVDDPVLVVEVLSEGTGEYDLTRKRLAYYNIPSLRQMAFVAQDEPTVEIATRQPDGRWASEIVRGLDGVADLNVLEVRLSLGEIYEGIDLSTDEGTTAAPAAVSP